MHEAIEQRAPRRRTVAFGVLGFLALGVFLVLGEARSDALAVTEQTAEVENSGEAAANSGGNVAVGNASSNEAANVQAAGAGGEEAVAVNVGGASNESDGTAIVATGDASAAGVVSSTEVAQAAGDGGDGGVAITEQSAEVENAGAAAANTGGNVAVGNASENEAVNLQGAFALGDDDEAVAVNIGGAANVSDGTAVIVTGDATAIGVAAWTGIAQLAGGGGGGLSLTEQEAEVVNAGLAGANTGGNIAVGNVSDNEAVNLQVAFALGDDDEAVAMNLGGAANVSDGTAVIWTGDATAVGVAAWTGIAQIAGYRKW